MKQCPVCYIGILSPRRGTYADWHQKQPIFWPGATMWTCDVCGELICDPEIVRWINALSDLEHLPGGNFRKGGPKKGLQFVFAGMAHRRRSII